MSTTRINFKSDLPPVAVTFKINGVSVNVPDHDFAIRFFVDGAPGRSFICSKKGSDYEHCEKTNATTLTCYIDNHGFGCGRLCCEFVDLATNTKYADGKQKTVTPNRLDIVLVEGQGDDIVSVESSVIIDITALIADVNAALEEMEGYAAIIAALQAAVQTIPVVVDDLETGGHTAALSAEQGKILKQLLDQLEQISIEGIKGFAPISSLNDLPADPTDEQKRYAYLYENAVYVYVGIGGNTLDGKYQSVDLVSLDWGDKSYAPLEFSGLGRKWLKKNIVNSANVLTSEMISTANTEYYIQYDYDLNNSSITLPANSTLVFMGGSIKNGTLVGNNTRIVAQKGVQIFDTVTIQGTWDVAEAYSSWFKMHKKGYKIKSVTENGATLYKGTDNNYYDFDELTLVGSYYYVTSTLEGGEVVESSIKVTGTTYHTFRVEGYDTDTSADYIAAASLLLPGRHDFSGYGDFDDTPALQSLFDIRAKKTVIEDGIYMVSADTHTYGSGSSAIKTALYYDAQKDSELVIEGWIKLIQNDYTHSRVLDVVGCNNIRISGKGGVQGDLLEHTATSGEWSHVLTVSNTTGMTVENLTFAYAWGDCIYSHWIQNSRTQATRGDDMSNHTFKGVRVIYGGRTGYGCEHGDNVVFDSCYFYGTGRVRGKLTYSAVDVEPFSEEGLSVRYVKNYEFRNNLFENSYNGLRVEKCVNCSVHDNEFNYGTSGVLIVRNTDVSYNITSSSDRGWLKSRLNVYNNIFRRCSKAVQMGSGDFVCENVEIYNNTFISCTSPFNMSPKTITATAVIIPTYKNCNIHDNITYGCGQWSLDKMIDCEIYNNKNYACRIPEQTATWGGNKLLYFTNYDECSGTRFYNNSFSLDYGKSFFGLGANGKERIYHGLPVGYKYAIADGSSLSTKSKVHFYENKISDDFFVCYSFNNSFERNGNFGGGICSVKNESNKVFLNGDIFRSSTYGDEGIVITGAILEHTWLNDTVAPPFVAGMTVEYGEIVKIGTSPVRLKICNKAGTCGDSLSASDTTSGTAGFLNGDATGYYSPDNTVTGRLKIAFTKRGVCTSSTRPGSFLYAGRRMWERDTNKEIVYNGTAWVYNDIYTEE